MWALVVQCMYIQDCGHLLVTGLQVEILIGKPAVRYRSQAPGVHARDGSAPQGALPAQRPWHASNMNSLQLYFWSLGWFTAPFFEIVPVVCSKFQDMKYVFEESHRPWIRIRRCETDVQWFPNTRSKSFLRT